MARQTVRYTKNPRLQPWIFGVSVLFGSIGITACVFAENTGSSEADTQYRTGVQRAAEGDLSAAEATFQQAIASDKKAVGPCIALGELYLTGLGKTEKALQAYREAVTRDSQHSGARYGLGIALVALGQSEEAEAELKKSAALAPKNPLPLQALGRLYASVHQDEKAREAFDAALAREPKFAEAYIDRGNLWLARGDNKQAIAEYERALAVNPRLAEAHVRIGMVLQSQNRAQEAEQAYATAIQLDSTQSIAYNNLAWMALERKDNLDKALEWAEKAVELQPTILQFQDTLGWVHRSRGELDKAAAILEKASTLLDAKQALVLSQIFEHLSTVYSEQGKSTEATRAMHQSESLKSVTILERAAKEFGEGSQE